MPARAVDTDDVVLPVRVAIAEGEGTQSRRTTRRKRSVCAARPSARARSRSGLRAVGRVELPVKLECRNAVSWLDRARLLFHIHAPSVSAALEARALVVVDVVPERAPQLDRTVRPHAIRGVDLQALEA